MTTSAESGFRIEMLRESATRARAEATLTVLDTRGVTVPDEVREQILNCTDNDQVNAWLVRAVTATTVDEVIRE